MTTRKLKLRSEDLESRLVATTPGNHNIARDKKRVLGLIAQADGRSKTAKRLVHLSHAVAQDIEPRGFEYLPQVLQQLVKRFTALSVWCEQQDRRMAQGKVVNLELYTSISRTIRTIGLTIGVKEKREPEPITLEEYAAAHYRPKEEDHDDDAD